MIYSWGVATALVLVEAGFVTYQFLYPRFRAGDFGGQFLIDRASIPSTRAAPEAHVDGKFWLVNRTDKGPKAIYVVCTHFGCLYKWSSQNDRFECPCHGSKFTKDGFYIEGPAPRSFDYFEIEMIDDQLFIHTGKRIVGDPAKESPARVLST